jgi:hypothetical protein
MESSTTKAENGIRSSLTSYSGPTLTDCYLHNKVPKFREITFVTQASLDEMQFWQQIPILWKSA